MTHLAWEEVAEGCQRRAEERCEVEGHAWQQLDGIYSCRWCLALSESAPRPESEKGQAA